MRDLKPEELKSVYGAGNYRSDGSSKSGCGSKKSHGSHKSHKSHKSHGSHKSHKSQESSQPLQLTTESFLESPPHVRGRDLFWIP
jgi:hypothetical protein